MDPLDSIDGCTLTQYSHNYGVLCRHYCCWWSWRRQLSWELLRHQTLQRSLNAPPAATTPYTSSTPLFRANESNRTPVVGRPGSAGAVADDPSRCPDGAAPYSQSNIGATRSVLLVRWATDRDAVSEPRGQQSFSVYRLACNVSKSLQQQLLDDCLCHSSVRHSARQTGP